MSIDVRPLTLPDADAFIALRRQALVDSPAAFGSSPEDDRNASLSFVVSMLEGEGESMILGAFAPELIGTLGLYRDNHQKTAHKAHMWGMFVAPAYRGQGVGRKLLLAAIAHARTLQGITQVQPSVSAEAPGAKRLYETCGFVVWGAEPRALSLDGRFISEYHMSMVFEPDAP
jgi:RimJ/RimL family protein N-acetyltransferase